MSRLTTKWGIGLLLALLPATGAVLMTGCSGGGSRGASVTSDAGRSLIFSVQWPERSRLVPVASESIIVRIQRDGQTVAERTVNRPASGSATRVTLERLPPGELTAIANAYPEVNGRGVAQASGSARLTAEPGNPFTLTVTMDSTIESLEVSADRTSVFLDDSLTLNATARDRNGNVVLLGNTLRWSTSSSEAEIDRSSGVLVGRRVGTARITVEETESGARKTVDVNVRGVERIIVQPSVVQILDEDDAVLTAFAYDSEGQLAALSTVGWQWSIGSSSIAQLFGGGNSVRVGGFNAGHTEINLRTVAGGSTTVPVYVYPSRVSGSLSVTRSGYSGPSTVYVSGDSIYAYVGEGDSGDSDSLSSFLVDDSRLVLVELDDFDDDFTEDDSVKFTLQLSGPSAPNGRPYFVFADSGGTSVSGTLTRNETSQVFRLVVRDPISGDARSRKSRRGPEVIPSRAERRRVRPKG